GIAEIRATRALQHIAAQGRHVAQLLAGTLFERLDDDRVVLAHLWVIGGLAHAHQGSQPQTAFTKVNAAEIAGPRQLIDVDEPPRPHHVELHEVEKRRASGEEALIVPERSIAKQLLRAVQALISERAHHVLSILALPSRTAATMLGYAAQRQRLPLMNSRI